MTKFKIQKNDANQTIFNFIKKSFASTPLSVIYKWFRTGQIKLNNHRIKDKKIILKTDDVIIVYDSNKPLIQRDQFKYVKNPELTIVYEDENILIVDKPFNLEVHSPVNVSLDDWVKSYLVDTDQYHPQTENSFVVSHVHRLDKLTRGLVIYAKNKIALALLLEAIQDKKAIEKDYLLKTEKINSEDWATGFLSQGWLRYDPEQQISVFRLNQKNGYKKVETYFKLLKKDATGYWIETQLLTGRKHQIRATLAHYQMPILNDFRYGGLHVNSEKMIYLIAYKLVFHELLPPLNYLNGKNFTLQLQMLE